MERPAPTLDQRLERKVAAIAEVPRHDPVLRDAPRRCSLERSRASRRARSSRTRNSAFGSWTKTVAVLRSKVARPGRRGASRRCPRSAAICSVFGSLLRGGRRRGVVRVPAVDDAPRTASTSACSRWARTSGGCSATADSAQGAGGRGAPLLRALRPRLEPVGLPLGSRRSPDRDFSSQTARPRLDARVSLDAPIW